MNLGIIGATGIVGEELIKLIERNHLNVSISDIKLFASSKSKGKEILIKNKKYIVEELTEDSFENLDVVIFCSSQLISFNYAKIALQNNCYVIDNSAAFRLSENVPLVVPEINKNLVKPENKLICNPNCCVAILCTAIYPLHQKFKIKRLILSTYQSASGAGKEGLNELENQIQEYGKKESSTKVFGRKYLNNVFSHNSKVCPFDLYNDEEIKIIKETKKLLGTDVKVTATCVRVPVFRSHCISVNIEFDNKVELEEINDILNNSSGVEVVDNAFKNNFPEALNSKEKFDVEVGRIRYDLDDQSKKTINLFISGDQLLKGAALNAYQILKLVNSFLLYNNEQKINIS